MTWRLLIARGACLLLLLPMACQSPSKTPKTTAKATQTSSKSAAAKPTQPQPKSSPKSVPEPQSKADAYSRQWDFEKPLAWTNQALKNQAQARVALLMASDESVDPALNLPFARRNIELMKATLQSYCGIPSSRCRELSGRSMSRDGVEAALQRLEALCSGQDNLLLLYYTGHGFIGADQQPSFFTYYSQAKAQQAGYDKVIKRSDIAVWLAQLRARLEAKKRRLRVVFLADACRTNTLAPGYKARLRPAQDWEIFATGRGSLAVAPSRTAASPFTQSFAEVVKAFAKARENVFLGRLFQELKKQTMALTQQQQVPELVRSREQELEPRLLVSQRVHFGVEVVDALSGLQIPKAQVRVDRRRGQLGASGFFHCSGSPSLHLLHVSAPGYLTRSEPLSLDNQKRSRVLKVPLLPDCVWLRGRILGPPALAVSAQGEFGAARSGYHVLKTFTDAQGRFRLIVPRFSQAIELSVRQQGRVLLTRSLAWSPSLAQKHSSQAHDGLSVIELGLWTVARAKHNPDALSLALSESSLRQSAARLSYPLPKRYQRAPAAPKSFASELDRTDWSLALKALKNRKWTLAEQQLRGLKGQIPEPTRRVWLDWLKLERAESRDLSALRQDVEDARAKPELAQALRVVLLTRLSQSLSQQPQRVTSWRDWAQALPESRPDQLRLAALRWGRQQLARMAQQQLEQRRFQALLQFLSDFQSLSVRAKLPELESLLDELTRRCLEPLLAESLGLGIRQGQWQSAARWRRSWQAQSEPFRSRSKACQQLLDQIHRESIPLATRQRFRAAQAQFSDGQWLEAYQSYQQVAQEANDHYRAKALEQLTFLRQRLTQRLLAEAFEHELEGRLGEALTAYEQSLRFQQRGLTRLRRLLEDPRLKAQKYQAQRQRLVDKLAALKAERVALLKQRQSLARALLSDRKRWLKATTTQQDQVIQWLEEGLGPDFERLGARSYRCGKKHHRIARFKHIPSAMVFHLIPGGLGTQGARARSAPKDEKPSHVVRVPGFLMGRLEVTQAQWAKVLGQPAPSDGALPKERVSWQQCQAWLKRFDSRARLPTESEWEYALRAGSVTRYFWGREYTGLYSWTRENSGLRRHWGQDHDRDSNAFGLVDMTGNVWEWCLDSWQAGYRGAPVDGSAWQQRGPDKVVRGGSYLSSADHLRSSYRSFQRASSERAGVGLRVVLPLPFKD